MKVTEWAKLLEKTINDENVICPECGSTVLSELYANIINGEKIGFAILKCSKCNNEIKFSRVKFPDYANTKNF